MCVNSDRPSDNQCHQPTDNLANQPTNRVTQIENHSPVFSARHAKLQTTLFLRLNFFFFMRRFFLLIFRIFLKKFSSSLWPYFLIHPHRANKCLFCAPVVFSTTSFFFTSFFHVDPPVTCRAKGQIARILCKFVSKYAYINVQIA